MRRLLAKDLEQLVGDVQEAGVVRRAVPVPNGRTHGALSLTSQADVLGSGFVGRRIYVRLGLHDATLADGTLRGCPKQSAKAGKSRFRA